MSSAKTRERKKTSAKTGDPEKGSEAGKEMPSAIGRDEPTAENTPKRDADSGESRSGGAENFEEKYDSLNDRFLRLAADFENYKKRSEKEKEQAQIRGIRNLALSIFQILDSLELALRHGEQSKIDSEGLVRGVRLTCEQSVSQLKNFGINQLSAEVGEKFNPAFHQAIENRPSDSVGKGCVAQEIAKGYIYVEGKVLLRPVVVAVSSGPEENSSGDGKREN